MPWPRFKIATGDLERTAAPASVRVSQKRKSGRDRSTLRLRRLGSTAPRLSALNFQLSAQLRPAPSVGSGWAEMINQNPQCLTSSHCLQVNLGTPLLSPWLAAPMGRLALMERNLAGSMQSKAKSRVSRAKPKVRELTVPCAGRSCCGVGLSALDSRLSTELHRPSLC